MNNAVHRLDAPRRARKGMASTTVDFSKPKKKAGQRADVIFSEKNKQQVELWHNFKVFFLETKIAGGRFCVTFCLFGKNEESTHKYHI